MLNVNFILKHKIIFLLLIGTLLLFTLLFRDVLFFGKTLRGEPYAQGVLPTGPVSYTREVGEFRSHTNDPGASAWNNDPPFVVALNQLKHGFIPWWNPYNGTGTPLLASLQSGIMFPPKLAILFLSSSPFMFDLYMIFRILIAFVFTYLFLRLFKIARPISFVSAFAFAFSGALFRYINLEHLNIDAFIPLYLFSAEYFLQKQNFKRWLLLTISFTFIILGGFPEASLFAFILVNSYFIFRWFSLTRSASLLKKWVYANVIALLLTLPVVIPFVIHMAESWTIHDPASHVGTLFLPFSIIFSLVTPYMFTPKILQVLNIEPTLLFPGWIGGGVLILAVMGAANFKKQYQVGAFFGIYGIVSILKDFGFFFVNWIGYFPFVNQAIVFKYNNPAMTFALVIASGFFLQYLLNNKPNKKQIFLGVLTLVIFYGSFIFQFHHAFIDFSLSRTRLLTAQTLVPKYLIFLIGITVIGLLVVLLVYLVRVVKGRVAIKILVGALLAIIALETFISLPTYHPLRDLGYPPVSFLTNLKNQAGSEYRISGRDYVLFPDIAAPYQINDPRILDAMYLKGFYQYVKTVDSSFYDRFINLSTDWMINPATLKAIGVKYILATNSLDEAANISDLNKDYQVPKDSYTIGGETRSVVSIHPPFDKTFKVVFPKGTNSAYFFIAMNPAVWSSEKGDGVCVDVSYSVNKETICTDPKTNPSDRVWKKVTLEKPKDKREVDLRIHVNQLGSTNYDWTGMTDLISSEEVNSISQGFSVTSGFPVTQDKIKIVSYTVKDPKEIAYFPAEVSFDKSKNIVSDVKNNLSKIDSKVFAEGKQDNVKQSSNLNAQISIKPNGDLTINLPKNHPKYLYISQAFHNNLNITNEKGQKVNWYKANLGFILADVSGSSMLHVTNSPTNTLKLVLLVLFAIGVSLIYLVYRTWKSTKR